MSIIEGSQVETEGETMVECCLLSCFSGLLSLHSCGTQDRHPTKVWLPLPHQKLIPPYKFAYSLVLWRHFLSLGSVFSVDSSLCHGDRETSQERVNVLIVFMHMSNVAILIRTWMNLQTTMPKEDAGHNRTYCVFSLCPKKNTI